MEDFFLNKFCLDHLRNKKEREREKEQNYNDLNEAYLSNRGREFFVGVGGCLVGYETLQMEREKEKIGGLEAEKTFCDFFYANYSTTKNYELNRNKNKKKTNFKIFISIFFCCKPSFH